MMATSPPRRHVEPPLSNQPCRTMLRALRGPDGAAAGLQSWVSAHGYSRSPNRTVPPRPTTAPSSPFVW